MKMASGLNRPARQQLRCPSCHSPRVRKAWGPAAMLGAGALCLVAAARTAALFLRAPSAQPRLAISLLLTLAGAVSLVRWTSYRGRTFFRCSNCGRIWARRAAE